ncbi:hypothetical protein LguiB_028455 [Lonicera macranthoides]
MQHPLEYNGLKKIREEGLLAVITTRLNHVVSLNGLILKNDHVKEYMSFTGRLNS